MFFWDYFPKEERIAKVGFFVPFCGFSRIEKPLFYRYNEMK